LFGGQLWNSFVVNGFLRHRASNSLQKSGSQSSDKTSSVSATSAPSIPTEPVVVLPKHKVPEVANLLPVQMVIFGLLWLVTGFWWSYFALWLAPIFTLGTFFGYLRGFIDHARLTDDDNKLAAGRLISVPNPSLWDRALLTGLDFHFHAEHHFFPAVPHYYLPQLHKILQNDEQFRDRYLVRPTYFSFLRDYWKQINLGAGNSAR
jgi:fatty acid desaturase